MAFLGRFTAAYEEHILRWRELLRALTRDTQLLVALLEIVFNYLKITRGEFADIAFGHNMDTKDRRGVFLAFRPALGLVAIVNADGRYHSFTMTATIKELDDLPMLVDRLRKNTARNILHVSPTALADSLQDCFARSRRLQIATYAEPALLAS